MKNTFKKTLIATAIIAASSSHAAILTGDDAWRIADQYLNANPGYSEQRDLFKSEGRFIIRAEQHGPVRTITITGPNPGTNSGNDTVWLSVADQQKADGSHKSVIIDNSGGILTDGNYDAIPAATKEEIEEIKKAIEEQKAREAAEREQRRQRQTKQAIAGAVAINILAAETINPTLANEGVSVGASVGGSKYEPEVKVGVHKDLGDGASASLGIGAKSGDIGVGVRQSFEVNEYVKTSVGAGIDQHGINAGVGATIEHNGFGAGGQLFLGIAPVPVVVIFGYQVPVLPQLMVPNLIVTGVTAIYQQLRKD